MEINHLSYMANAYMDYIKSVSNTKPVGQLSLYLVV